MEDINKQHNLIMRKVIGGIILSIPYIVILVGLIGSHFGNNPDNWWHSISATYYTNANAVMVSLIAIASFFFCTYPGYSKIDRILNIITGVCLFLVLLFPCGDSNLTLPDRVGLLQLTPNVSQWMHMPSANIAFLAFAINIRILFTKTSGEMTNKKKIRNIIYKICSYVIILCGIPFALGNSYICPHWFILMSEAIALTMCGIAWLIKGETFKILND